MSTRLAPGECMTEVERLAIVGRVLQIARMVDDGRLTLAEAQHEAQAAIGPIKRRVRRLARRRHEGGMR